MKVVKRIALILLILWSVFTTLCCVASVYMHSEMEMEYAELEAKYTELQKDYAELEEESENIDIDTIRGLAYELLFENVYYEGVLGEEYALNAKIDEVVEQHDMSETEEMELLAMLRVLIEKYDIAD